MKVILLERVGRHGTLGETVRVRDGFARNYLLPQGKALRATKENQARFDRERAVLESRNAERKSSAEQIKIGLDQRSFVVRDIVDILAAAGETVTRSQVDINTPIKNLGVHKVEIVLHADVRATITLNIARSEDEAQRQAKGEDVTAGAREDTFVREVGSVLDEEGMDREEL